MACMPLTREDPLYTADSSDFGNPGPIIDFQAPLSHTLITGNSRKKGKFENLFLEGRPPLSVGVTNSGHLMGGTQVAFTDVLGDQQFWCLRCFNLTVPNASRLVPPTCHDGSNSQLKDSLKIQFFYGFGRGTFFDPAFGGFMNPDDAVAVRTMRGGTVFGIYPFSRYRRLTFSGGLLYQ